MSTLLLAAGVCGILFGRGGQGIISRFMSAGLFLAAIIWGPTLLHIAPKWVLLSLIGGTLILAAAVALWFKHTMKQIDALTDGADKAESRADELKRQSDDIARAKSDPIGRRGMSPAAALEVETQQSRWR